MMNEARAREIHNATDLHNYSHNELREADLWIKKFAMNNFRKCLDNHVSNKSIKDLIDLMVSCHYGSIEVNDCLTELGCFPTWTRN